MRFDENNSLILLYYFRAGGGDVCPSCINDVDIAHAQTGLKVVLHMIDKYPGNSFYE